MKKNFNHNSAEEKRKETCRWCVYFDTLDTRCRINQFKLSKEMRLRGCNRYQKDLWAQIC